jgi:hypothetical protein
LLAAVAAAETTVVPAAEEVPEVIEPIMQVKLQVAQAHPQNLHLAYFFRQIIQ